MHAWCSILHFVSGGDSTVLAAAIGSRVRRARLARGMTLEQLAAAAETSRRSVINVEQGTANPSVNILLRLSDALGIGLPTLVAPPAQAELTVTTAAEAPTLWTGEHGGQGRLIAGTSPPDVVELWAWAMTAGERHDSEPHAEGTQELLHVTSGVLRVQVGGESVVVRAGEVLTFASDVAHAYLNDGDGPAAFDLVVFEPGVGSAAAGPAGESSHG